MHQVAVRTAQEGGARITVNQKILVHLVEYVRYQDRPEAPKEITQQGISEVVGARRSHISLALSTLRERGLVEERTVRVTDEVRRRKGYFLTSKGYEAAKDLVAKFLARTVRVESPEGIKEVKISDLSEVLGDRYYLVDVLCCVNREGTLDVAQLTGQIVETPPAMQPLQPQSAAKAVSTRATTFCPNCGNRLDFPYDTETMFNVVCGSCGNSFRASVGTPIYGQVAPPPAMGDFTQQEPPADLMRGARKTATSASLLAVGAGLSLFGAISLASPFSFLTLCGFGLPGLIILFVAATGIKDPVPATMAWGSVAMTLSSVGLIFVENLSLLGLGLLWAAPLVAIAAALTITGKTERTRLAMAIAFSAASMFFPLIGWWGIPVAFGLLFGAGALLGGAASTKTEREGRDKDVFVAATLAIMMAILTYGHWIFVSRWDPMAVARVSLLSLTAYAFALLAQPITAKTRAESAVALGSVLMAISVPAVLAPWLLGLTADYAGYFVVLGAGSVYMGTRLHKLESMWPSACLGVGVSVAAFSLAALAIQYYSLSPLWRITLLLWTIAGAAMCIPRLLKRPTEMLLSVRTGAIAATGTAVILAGAYMLLVGLGMEGAVEIALGAPLLGFAIARGGAPWRPKLAMCCLLMTSVGLTWISLVADLL